MVRDRDEELYRAIAAQPRRRILDLLRGGEQVVGDLVVALEMTQPAVSQHLQVLREAHLVAVRQEGRRRLYRLTADPLQEVHDWVAHYQRFWRRLDALGDYLEEEDHR